MKIIASIQARMGSTRLPGKVLKEINGQPMLLRHVMRLRRSRLIDDVIVATTVNPADDAIASFCQAQGITCFRGSEDDVLGRIASMIEKHEIDIHVECFGDSPLTDPHIVDEVVGYYLKHKDQYDFVSNSLRTTYPPGQEVLVYGGDILLRANKDVETNDPLREHVSIHITRHPETYRIQNLEAPPYYRFPEIYLEVDTPEDFEMVHSVFTYFDQQGYEHFSLAQILDYLHTHQELIALNNHVERRWKQYRKETDV